MQPLQVTAPPEAAEFHAFGPSHWAVLEIGAAVLVVMILVKWLGFERVARVFERTLGSLLLLVWPTTLSTHLYLGTLTLNNGLPLHFCDVAAIAGGIALWRHSQWACEMVYFMGLAGTLQGLLTPNLAVDFPDPRFFAFFILHCGVVIAAIYVVSAMRHSPPPGAVWRLMKVTLSYAVIVSVINAVLGTNYAFLCAPPTKASLMDHLGTWPLYVGSLVVLALIFYSLLNIPFVILRRMKSRSS